MKIRIPESELVLNKDGSVYHLMLKPEHIADNIIVVGDQDRVNRISRYFDRIEYKIQNREFITHTGWFSGKRITAISTGIGPDNIDIVMNELDAAVNIDLQERSVKDALKSLNIIRIGTSGSLQPDIPVDSTIISCYGIGIDGLLHYYENRPTNEEKEIASSFISHCKFPEKFNRPYAVKGSEILFDIMKEGMYEGITITAHGFYGPQGRALRLAPYYKEINDKLSSYSYNGLRITNYEMETSALYGLGKLMGHNCCTVCAVIANRHRKEYSNNSSETMDKLIQNVLERTSERL